MLLTCTLNLKNALPDIGTPADGTNYNTSFDENTEKGWKILFPDMPYPASDDTVVYLLRQYNQPAATATLHMPDAEIGELSLIAVNKYYHGHNFALHILLHILQDMREKGMTTAVLHTDSDNLTELSYAKALGFTAESACLDELLADFVDASELPHEVRYLWKNTAPYSGYSPNQAQPSVTCFPVENSKGAVVVCPGGGYGMKADHEGTAIANMLNECGVSAFVLDYRVKPCHHAAPLSDANRAVRLVRSMGYAKVGIMGFSAGGNLTCCAAVHYDNGNPDSPDPIERYSSRPDAFIPCYAVVSLTQFTHVQTRQNLLKDRRDDQALARYFSAEQHITEDTPPAFIWHSATDEMVPVDNSLILGAAMAAKGVPFEMHIFPEGLHGLGLAKELPVVARWSDMACDWLERQGFKA